jgi:hypothetical protein
LSVSQRTHERWGSWSILQPQELTTQSINFLHTINFFKKDPAFMRQRWTASSILLRG